MNVLISTVQKVVLMYFFCLERSLLKKIPYINVECKKATVAATSENCYVIRSQKPLNSTELDRVSIARLKSVYREWYLLL